MTCVRSLRFVHFPKALLLIAVLAGPVPLKAQNVSPTADSFMEADSALEANENGAVFSEPSILDFEEPGDHLEPPAEARAASVTPAAALPLAVPVPMVAEPFGDQLEAPSAAAQESTLPSMQVEATANTTELPKADNIDLKEVIIDLQPMSPQGDSAAGARQTEAAATAAIEAQAPFEVPDSIDGTTLQVSAEESAPATKIILGVEVPPNTSARLVWTPEGGVSGLAENTPVLVINGKNPGKTLCLTAAVHGDELNGIEMIRRIMYELDPDKLTGTVIGVPVVNLMGFRRNTRYLPDRRDLNRYFPGNARGSSASRIAHSFFSEVISHCDALVDIHTGSFHRTNLPQLRADLSNERVAELAHSFGPIAVLNSRGNSGSLRAAAVRAGIPTVAVEAGEPLRLQDDIVQEGTKAIQTLLAKLGMYGRQRKGNRYAPVYYKSAWVRANQGGILFSRVALGKRVAEGEVLGSVTDPITNLRSDIVSPYHGRVLGMALNQLVLPGFAAYHIGIQTPEAILIEQSLMEQLEDEGLEEEDGWREEDSEAVISILQTLDELRSQDAINDGFIPPSVGEVLGSNPEVLPDDLDPEADAEAEELNE